MDGLNKICRRGENGGRKKRGKGEKWLGMN